MARLPSGEEEKMKVRGREEKEESFSRAMQLASSIVLPMALHSAAELGVFEVLGEREEGAKLSAKEIASKIGCSGNPESASMIDRLLALLASHSILNASLDNQNLGSFRTLYSITPVARFFAPNSDGVSLAPLMTLSQDKVFLSNWPELKVAIREGGIAFNRVHGTNAFDYPRLDAGFNQVFNTAMINHTTIVMKKVLECYKGFENIRRLVDFGGGLGININLITSKYPHIQGINFDLPHVVEHAPSYPGVEHVGGDMFEKVPKADAIFMKWILHDWNDKYCLKLLKNCYAAIPDDGKVIVMESVIPIIPDTSAASKVISQFNVVMMTHFQGGKERTKQEFMDLATAAGFSGIKYESYVCTCWVMEFFK